MIIIINNLKTLYHNVLKCISKLKHYADVFFVVTEWRVISTVNDTVVCHCMHARTSDESKYTSDPCIDAETWLIGVSRSVWRSCTLYTAWLYEKNTPFITCAYMYKLGI